MEPPKLDPTILAKECERKKQYYANNREKALADAAKRYALRKTGKAKPSTPRIPDDQAQREIDYIVLSAANIIGLKTYGDIDRVKHMYTIFNKIRLILSTYLKMQSKTPTEPIN
jgi:hypothetical protein